MSVFKDAKLTLITDDGTELNVDVTPEKLAAIVRSCGFTARNVSEKRLMLFSFDDFTIRNNILPLLPMVKSFAYSTVLCYNDTVTSQVTSSNA